MNKAVFFIFSWLVFAFSIQSQNLDSALTVLDTYLDDSERYIKEKESKISSLHKSVTKHFSQPNKLIQDYSDLYDEYKSYKYDSAFYYASKTKEIAVISSDANELAKSSLRLMFCYLSSGLFKESFDLSNEIDISKCDTETCMMFYKTMARLYYDMADYNRVEPFRENYIHKGLEYSKMALSLLKPESSEYLGSVALYNLKLKDYPEAIDNFNKALINNKNLREIAINASSLGYIYTLTNEYDKAAIKIIDAAIADIQSSTKETVALRLLATLLYEKKQDIDRAYKYIKVALDDASVYNARHRKIEIGQILPIIEKERITTVEEQRNLLIWLFSLVFVLFVMFLVSTIIINKQLKKIKIARQTIEEQNTKLLNINAKLTETSSIKDKYIGNFFYNIYQNISNLEHIYRSANKKLTTKNYDELAKSFKQSDLEHKRENMYKSFDETFLNLFPNFIEEYEKLFTPEELEHSHKHTNSLNIEMRIFALIRLGVYESEKISKFLNYSVHTINTYKTKVKNKSWVQNEQFEARIMEIRSVKSI